MHATHNQTKKEGIQLNHRMSIPRVHGSETLSCTDIQDVL
jgi:hypothetical protein